ncbi:ParB/RepB/Spo0J family partition protein [Shewanella glacialipiscicola]|uniref:ParB/RepB/Spo0J family partition protein n=1 Tax=Shewanella glacialipiscicola TaxID=614069 RepID=UPI003D7AE923
MAPKIPIGRNRHMDNDADTPVSKKIKFKSGRTVEFFFVHISAEHVEELTYVEDSNIRIGEELTKESLAPIIESIRHNQFQPVIAQKINDRYSVADGSRRRKSAIFANVGLDLWYCLEALSKAEVKQLIKEISSAEKFSLRDLGRYFEQLRNTDPALTYDQIAENEGYNKGLISKAISAWEIPSEIIQLFPIPREITYTQFAQLSKIMTKLQSNQWSLAEFISKLNIKVGTTNEEVFQFICEESEIKKKTVTDKPIKIVDINKDTWVKTRKVGSKRFIEMSRVTQEDISKIESFIVELLAKTNSN